VSKPSASPATAKPPAWQPKIRKLPPSPANWRPNATASSIVARDIEDEPNNTTRFLVLGPEETAPSGRDKTSLVLSVRNKPGALLELLAPFAGHDIGLSKLESRPARSGAWEYVFYVDLEGHSSNPEIQRALEAVREHCTFLKVLGAYPIAA
jgi:chorismate mutase/prephenate dehydratase